MKLLEDADIFGCISVGDNTHIRWNAIIMPNAVVGKNYIIGCGAVVTKANPDNSIAVGVPTKVIKTINEYYEKNKFICDITKNLSKQEKKEYLIKKYNLY